MNLCIFIISVVRPAGTRNPPEIRGCGCGCRNAPAGLLAGGFFPIPRVCLRAGFRQTRTRTHGCHPYLQPKTIEASTPLWPASAHETREAHCGQDIFSAQVPSFAKMRWLELGFEPQITGFEPQITGFGGNFGYLLLPCKLFNS